MIQLLSILFGVVVSGTSVTGGLLVPLDQWQVAQHDRFIVDTAENVGYLVHENGNYTSFLVGTGKRSTVHYLGMSYYAATPNRYWVVKGDKVFTDRRTFGKTGRFFRLFKDGTVTTKYGIHSTSNIDELLARDNRYVSMGCILVSDYVLDIIEATYLLNDNTLEVMTVNGVDASQIGETL